VGPLGADGKVRCAAAWPVTQAGRGEGRGRCHVRDRWMNCSFCLFVGKCTVALRMIRFARAVLVWSVGSASLGYPTTGLGWCSQRHDNVSQRARYWQLDLPMSPSYDPSGRPLGAGKPLDSRNTPTPLLQVRSLIFLHISCDYTRARAADKINCKLFMVGLALNIDKAVRRSALTQ
jgi:hypothetical protein